MFSTSYIKSNLKRIGLFALIATNILSYSSCNPTGSYSNNDSGQIAGNLRLMTPNERALDFDQLVNLFKTYYGPYEYKERTLKINIEAEAAKLKKLAIEAKTDEEFTGYVQQLGAILKDGHISLEVANTNSGISRYKIPLFITPVENKYLVGDVADSFSKESGIDKGDELLSVDGKDLDSYLNIILKYDQWATKISSKHLIYNVLSRPSYMAELVPQTTNARLVIKKTDGSILNIDLPWNQVKYNAEINSLVKYRPLNDTKFIKSEKMNSIISNAKQMGSENPFFLTEKVTEKYNFTKVYPSDSARAKAGLEKDEKPPIYASIYKHQNKLILLARMATYSPDDYEMPTYIKAYKALFSEYQDKVDILVLDQTHNPGGSLCGDFYNLFSNENDVQTAQKCSADRKWINTLSIDWPAYYIGNKRPLAAKILQSNSLVIEKAYDENKKISDAIPLFNSDASFFSNSKESVWKKPMLVLIDELAGSCGDVFPMLVKANKRAQLFGQQTMGLGGSVENVGTLNHSRINVKITRGLFSAYKADGKYTDADFAENNGVMPDISYAHTIKDTRAGYVDYVKAFSDEALKQIQEEKTEEKK